MYQHSQAVKGAATLGGYEAQAVFDRGAPRLSGNASVIARDYHRGYADGIEMIAA